MEFKFKPRRVQYGDTLCTNCTLPEYIAKKLKVRKANAAFLWRENN